MVALGLRSVLSFIRVVEEKKTNGVFFDEQFKNLPLLLFCTWNGCHNSCFDGQP